MVAPPLFLLDGWAFIAESLTAKFVHQNCLSQSPRPARIPCHRKALDRRIKCQFSNSIIGHTQDLKQTDLFEGHG